MLYLSRAAQFILGVIVGVGLLAVGSLATARYLVEQFTITPPRPVFAEEQPQPEPEAAQAKVAQANDSQTQAATPPVTQPEPSPSPSPEPGVAARVTWPQGLIVRGAPSVDAGSIGGVDFDVAVQIIETSADGNWEKITWENGEGWVKAGNLAKEAE